MKTTKINPASKILPDCVSKHYRRKRRARALERVADAALGFAIALFIVAGFFFLPIIAGGLK